VGGGFLSSEKTLVAATIPFLVPKKKNILTQAVLSEKHRKTSK